MCKQTQSPRWHKRKRTCRRRGNRRDHLTTPWAEGPQRISGGGSIRSAFFFFLQQIFTEHLLQQGVIPVAGYIAVNNIESFLPELH